MITDARDEIQNTKHEIRNRIQGSGFGILLHLVFCLPPSAFCLLFFAGCASQQPPEAAAEPLCITGLDRVAVMKASEDVLSEMHFAIEKADADSGLIRTSPLPGAQFFEFWRSDNVGGFNSAESNLHSIRRTVELNMTPQGENLCLGCNVKVERLSLPERKVSSSRAYQMFSESTASLQKLTLDPKQKVGMAWVDLGRDNHLAAEILKRISSMLDARRSISSIAYRESLVRRSASEVGSIE